MGVEMTDSPISAPLLERQLKSILVHGRQDEGQRSRLEVAVHVAVLATRALPTTEIRALNATRSSEQEECGLHLAQSQSRSALLDELTPILMIFFPRCLCRLLSG